MEKPDENRVFRRRSDGRGLRSPRCSENGHQVNVWNRDPAKAKALEVDGAHAFADAAEAIEGVERIHLSLSDDASVDSVLEPLAGSIPASTFIIDHTTTAPTPTVERIARWAGRGKVFIHAPVFMAPVNTREGIGMMLDLRRSRRRSRPSCRNSRR